MTRIVDAGRAVRKTNNYVRTLESLLISNEEIVLDTLWPYVALNNVFELIGSWTSNNKVQIRVKWSIERSNTVVPWLCNTANSGPSLGSLRPSYHSSS